MALLTAVPSGVTAASNSVTVPYSGRIAVNNTNFTGTGQFKFAIVDNGSLNTPPIRRATATAVLNSAKRVIAYTVTDGGVGYTTNPSVAISGGGGSGATAEATVSNGVVVAVDPINIGNNYLSAPTVTIDNPPAPVSSTVFQSFWSHDNTSNQGSEPTGFVEVPVTKGLYSVDLGDPAILGMNSLPDTAIKAGAKLRVWFNDGTRGFQQLSPDVSLGMAAISRAVEAQANASDAKQGSIATSNNLASTTTSLTSQINTVNGNLSSATNQLGTQIGTVSNTLNTSLGNLANNTASSFTAVSNNLSQMSNSLAGAVFTNSNSLQRILHQNLAAIYGLPPLSDSGHLVLYARDGVVTGVNSVLLTRDGTNFTPVRYPLRNLGIQTPKTWIQDRQGNDLYFILSNGIAGAAHRDLTNYFPFAATTITREIIFDEAVTPNCAGAISSNGVPTIWRHQIVGGAPVPPTSLTTTPTGLSGAVQLTFNDHKALALLANGTVTNWGDNNNLQAPADLTNVRSIAIADNQGSQDKGAAILNDGSVCLFGSGINGQLSTIPASATNIRAIKFFRDNVIAITATNDGSRVIMWGSDNLEVPAEATNVESAFGFTFGDNARFFVQARRFDGSLVIWGNVASELTNVPTGLTNIVRLTLLGTNFRDYAEIRRNPYIVAETGDGKVAIWGGRGTNGGNDPYFGYLTNRATPVAEVTKLTIHNYSNISSFYPIVVAERGSNTPVVWANNSLSNTPSYATNLSRLILTGGTNGSESYKPRFLVGETTDHRVVIWSNAITGSYGTSYLGERTNSADIQDFKLVGTDTAYPVIVARQRNNSLLVWGGNVSQSAGTNFIPAPCSNVVSFMTLDPGFRDSNSDRNVSPLVIANTAAGKIFSWWATGQGGSASYDSIISLLNSLADAKLFPYSQEELGSSGEGGYYNRTDPTSNWPILFAHGFSSNGPISVAGHSAPPGIPPAVLTTDVFNYSEIEKVFPLGSARHPGIGIGDTYSYSVALKMRDGTLKILYLTDAIAGFDYNYSRSGLYCASPNTMIRKIFSGKEAGITTGSSSGPGVVRALDNFVIIAEPATISP
jgi:hypothetical protein